MSAARRAAAQLLRALLRRCEPPEPSPPRTSWFSRDPDKLPSAAELPEGRLARERRLYGHSYFGPPR